jgi:hypothetical protein
MQNRTQKIIIAVLALLLVVVSGALVSQVFFIKNVAPIAVAPVKNNNVNYQNSTNVNIPINSAVGTTLAVTWLSSAQSVGSDYLNTIFKIAKSTDPNDYTEYYKVATVSDGDYKGDDLYYFSGGCTPDSCGIQGLAIAIIPLNKLVILGKYSSIDITVAGLTQEPEIFKNAITDTNLTIPELTAPDKLNLKNNYVAARSSDVLGAPNDTLVNKISETADGTAIYDHADIKVTYSTYDRSGNDLAIRLKDGEYIKYTLKIPFYGDNRIPDIKWNNGTKNATDYQPYPTGGCGAGPELNIVPDLKLSDLTATGTASDGEKIYEYKNSNAKELKDLFAQWIAWKYNDARDKTYAGFLEMHPFFFWVDPFGRIIRWTRPDLNMSEAECGKPVVYLYPTKTEDISVKLGSNITVTKSEPTYTNGWKVNAEPNGTLTTVDGKTFPYLYWDGNGANYATPTTGFVVASKNVEATLTEKLTRLGLNAKEISDFNEFWVPIVSKSPYALISFVPQDKWSKAAPLVISPAPETMIRVFMDWKPLAKPISIAPQILPPTPSRTGFTAVEWGGLLYR